MTAHRSEVFDFFLVSFDDYSMSMKEKKNFCRLPIKINETATARRRRMHVWPLQWHEYMPMCFAHKLFIIERKRSQTPAKERCEEKRRKKNWKKKENSWLLSACTASVRAKLVRDREAITLEARSKLRAINTRSLCRQFISSLKRIAQLVTQAVHYTKNQFKMKFIVLVR